MKEMWTAIRSFIRDEEGATATEYAVMLALIILIALGAIIFLGQEVRSGFSTVASAISSASGGGS